MAKQLNVSLAFTANTNEAIAAIKRLQKELNGLATGKSLQFNGLTQITPEIQRAMVAAGELQAKLEAATNVQTGKLDLSQFSDSLKKGGVSLQQYATQLNALGPAGRSAFTNLASAIMQAEAPLMRCSQRVKELGTSLANTARWQLSSSILHGFMGTIQSAYGYAKDLNESLNDIRIVTGASVAEMDAFAAKANKAAKALSTTTNEYAKASLIYFQQGDNQEQAMDKASVTAKMANVTGQSAEVVSNQLTAIWNNFNKAGDVSYEHYADVLTKLGAATASSTDEIAGGLEKFAGIADQIGLSYEYAASALATITATSRESEDVVGTALKTIFARIQGLSLGETLDDGTNLNKYSEALQKVGISIFDQAGELKDMDDILEEMADKWGKLSRDQQTALAQTVAGVRQYNQLMTLMNNWDVMDRNLVMANSADGELNKQHEIYAEGWEAASDRVRTSAEKLYTQVLNDDFFIDFLNGVSKAIDGVSSLVDAFGGLKGVLFTVGAFATTLFQKEITKGLKNAAYNLKQLTPLGKKEQEQTKADALNALQSMKSTSSGASGKAENSALSHEVAMQQTLMANAKALTDEEVKQLQIQMDLVRSLDERAIATAKLADASKEELETLREKNKVQAQMDAKMKVRADAKHTGETNFAKRALKAADSGGRKTLVEQYYKQQKHAAEAQVRQTHGLDPKASLQGFESEVQEAFVNGIRQAAQADGASEIAQKVGKELENSISMAMSGVSKQMSKAMADARKEIESYDQQIDKAAKASASAKSLGATKQTSAFTGDGDAKAAKSAKELAALQETLKTKITQTRAAAEELAGSLSDVDMNKQLSSDIDTLRQMEDQLNQTGMEAQQLQDILDNLNATASSGDYEGMSIDDRIRNAADVAGQEAERDGTANTQGQNVDFTGQYEAAKKRATTEIGANDAEADSNTQMQMFDEQVEGNSKGVKNWASDISNATSVVMGLGSAITSIQGAINVFSNPDATGWDKFSAVLSVIIGITSALPPILNLVGTSGAAAGAGMTAAMGPVGWILLAIVAAITAIVAAFSIWDACTVSAAEKTERLTENVQKMKEAASDAKEEAEGLKDAFDEYKDVKSTLEECTVGTTEWKTAMEGVKGAIDGILEAYPGLAKVANVLKWDDKTQSYILDEEKVNDYIQGKEDAANAAFYGSQMAEGQLKANEGEQHIASFDEAKSYFYGSGGAGENGFNGLSVQNLTGNRDLDRKTIEEAMKNDILANGWLDMSAYGTTDAEGNIQWNEGGQEQFEADMQSYLDGWSSVVDEMLGIAEVYHGINNEANTIFDNATKTAINDKFAGQGLTEAEMNAAAKATQDSYDDIYTELYGTDGTDGTMQTFNKGQNTWESLTDEGRAILERYEQAVGEDITWDKNLVQGTDAQRTFHIQGQEEGIKPEEIAATIAAYEALGGEEATDAQKESMNVVKDALGGANDIGDAFITAITQGGTSTAMTDFLSNLTPDQAQTLTSGIDPETGVLTEDALATLGISPETFAQLADMFGITVEELSANLAQAGDNIVTTTEHLHDNSAKAVQEASKNFSGLSINDQRKVGNVLQDSYMHQGEGVMNNLSTVFQNAGDDAGTLADIISGIDWTSDNAVYDLNNALAQQGISVSQLGPEWDAYVTHMTTATTSVYTFISALDTLRGKMASINDITDGLEFGGVISDEDYETLLSYNKEIADMFTMTADGWKFIGDIDTLNSALETSIEDVGQFKEEFSAAQNAGDVITNYAQGWKMDDGSYKIGGDYMKNDQQKALALNTFLNEDAFGEGTFDPIIETSGYSREALDDAISTVANATEADKTTQAYQDALVIVESFYGTAQGFIDDYVAGKFEETAAEELWVNNQIHSLDELDQAYQDGQISLETYHKMRDSVFNEEVKAEGFDTEEVNNYVDALIESGEFLEENREEAQKFALAQTRMERGFGDLVEGFEEWDDILSDNEASLKDISRIMPKVNSTLQDMMDLSDEEFALLPDNFAKDNWNLIQDVYNEVDGAYEALRAKITEEIVMKVVLDESAQSQVMTEVNNFLANVNLDDIEVGATLDSTGFAAGLQGLLDSGAVTVEQMNDILSGIGYEPVIEYEQVAVSSFDRQSQQGYIQVAGVDGSIEYVPITSDMDISGEQYVYVPKIGSSKYKGGGGGVSDAKANKGGGGGGGGGKPKKADTVKKQDVVDRYKETDDKLDDIRDKMDDASKAADRLWGPARLKQMKKVNEALEDEIDALKKKRKEAQDNLEIDKQALKDTIKDEAGVTITDKDFDKNGNFIKYDEVLTDLYEDLDDAIAKANVDGDADEDEQEVINELQERIDKVKEAIDQYDETRELIEDLDNDIQDKIYEWQDNNYEQLNYKLELEMEINDAEMERLEYYLEKTEGNIYKTAEAFTKMKEITDVYNDNLSNQAQYVADLEKAYYAGEISLDAYKEGLRESQSATIENLQALQKQKEAMQDYYGEVMDLALEEIALYIDEMEELNSVLDHYSEVLELVGKQEDYATKGKVLQSKATNLRNEMQVQQKLYEESNAEAEKWAEKMANATEGSNEYETYKKNWIAAQEAANEAQDNMLSKTEEWAKAMKAVVENELADLAHTMEESLTGGTSFDELLTSMERRSSLQEEYLTTTNQIYETNKLMRQAQQEIDKTTNSAAKRRLQGFINETAHMQDQNKLSQYELDIQQAKYDLLLAEIALEEAQNAKSTVRLQRDSEGNFGYVYTADSSAVAEAEQELADKQNALYNIGLEGANDYSQKYAETMQEAQDAITELTEMWMNGEIESEEEFQRRKAEIQDYYYEKLKQYSNLYQVALTTDSNVIKDAWSSDFNDMMYKTEEWKGTVDEYFVGAAESMQTWAEVCATVLEESGLDDISTKVGEIDQKSQALKTTLIGEDGESGVVGAMMSEVEAAGKLSEAYIGIQNEIDKLIDKYEELLEKVNEDYTNPDTEVVDPAIDPDEEEEEEEEEPTPPAPDPDPPAPELKVGSKVMVKKSASRWASGSGIWDPVKGNNFKVKQIKGDTVLIGDPCGPNYSASGYTGWIKKSDLEGFDTGGYTGSWGSYGKLAMLHEKELVLNAHDTDNFLNTMEVMERILQMLDLQTMSSQLGGILSSPALRDTGNQVIEQHIEIEANFPEATDRFEIEEAFKSMANLASQYANRK